MEGSSLDTGSGNDRLRISANARGNTTDTIAAYGAVDSQLDTGSGNDRVDIRAAASTAADMQKPSASIHRPSIPAPATTASASPLAPTAKAPTPGPCATAPSIPAPVTTALT